MSILLINKQAKKITVASDDRSLIGDFVISDNIKKNKKDNKKTYCWFSWIFINKHIMEFFCGIEQAKN